MVARSFRVLVVLVVVMGLASSVAAGEELDVVTGARVPALKARKALDAPSEAGMGMGAEKGTEVLAPSPWREPATAISEKARMVSAGYAHTCALTVDGGVKCWGANGYGQLGDGTTNSSATPVDVVGLSSGVVGISTGQSHTCALSVGGGVKCWGANGYGQLGDGTTENHTSPVDVRGLENGAVAIDSAETHTCVVTVGGGVKCWGSNHSGQLGDGTYLDSTAPVDVVGLSNIVVAVSAGGDFVWSHTCALVTDGGVKCWGDNGFGQLGDGTTDDSTTPVDVLGLSSATVAIATGQFHTCALTTDGGLKCWGDNYHGQLGNGTAANATIPVDVVGLRSNVGAIDAGALFTCAVTADGVAKCWGDNTMHQLGDGTSIDRNTPADVGGLSRGMASTVSAGYGHACVVTVDGGTRCWGANDFGQLGDGAKSSSRSSPVDVTGLFGDMAAISAGVSHTCILTAGGGAKCWGNNNSGQLGDGTTRGRFIPLDVLELWTGIGTIDAGGWHSCAVTKGGVAKCWGINFSGQLGDGTTMSRSIPSDVAGLSSGVATISAAVEHTCALTSSGGVKCWGYNWYGQLGDGTGNSSTTPVDAVGLSNGTVVISSGQYHTCALTTSGGIECWGSNTFGQLGDGTGSHTSNFQPTPVEVIGLGSGVAAISSGMWHTCAVTTAGGVKCWGNNDRSQLGDGTTTLRTAPVDVVGLSSGVTAVSAGEYHTCALTKRGGVKCWGDNLFGQLGDGTKNGSSTPVDVLELSSGVSAISAGYSHTCALPLGGGVRCWGRNDFGQLGINPGWTPVDVVGLEGTAYTQSWYFPYIGVR